MTPPRRGRHSGRRMRRSQNSTNRKRGRTGLTLVICGGLVLQRPFPPRSSRSHEHDTGEGDMSQTDATFVEMMAARARRQFQDGAEVVDTELERLVALARKGLGNEDAEGREASLCDLLNSWARESGVVEAEQPEESKALTGRL